MKIAISVSRISQSFNLYIVHFSQNDIKVHLLTTAFLQHSLFFIQKKRHRNTIGRRRRRSIAIPLSLFIIYYLPFSYFISPIRFLTRASTSSAPNTALPATNISTPASLISFIFASPTPPSISISNL